MYMDCSQNIESTDTNFDDLTLQLLLNTKNYKKVMKIKQPEKYNDEYQNTVFANESDILNITKDMIYGNTDNYSNDIVSSFHNYVKAIFKHREMEEIQEQNQFNREQYEDEEIEKYDYVQKSFWSGETVIKKF